ncbi:hypothetical protein ABZP36_022283 [Zizania latifolia]
MEELLPCTAYLRSGRPPSHTCCTAMHDAAADEMPCLCGLLADPELLRTFNVSRDQMFRLPARCGLPVGCHAGAAGSPEPGNDHSPAAFAASPKLLHRLMRGVLLVLRAVVEAPPPPGDTNERSGGASSSGGRRRSSVGRVISAVILSGAASVASLF